MITYIKALGIWLLVNAILYLYMSYVMWDVFWFKPWEMNVGLRAILSVFWALISGWLVFTIKLWREMSCGTSS